MIDEKMYRRMCKRLRQQIKDLCNPKKMHQEQRKADIWAKRQISNMRKKHPEHNWDAVNSKSGKPLWKEVVDYALKNDLVEHLESAYILFFFSSATDKKRRG